MFIPLSEIKQAGERSAELTRQLLALSRHQPQETRVLDVGAVVDGMKPMMGRVLGEKVEVELVRDSAACTVEAPSGQIEQILTNLVLNARDAMPNGGHLRIEVRAVEIADRDAKKRIGLRPGRHVLLRLTDTGVGMSADTLERIFEPFFTTKEEAKKEQGKGTGLGLGLSTVFGMVQQRSGHIQVESESGKGSTFEIYIPETKPRAPRPQESPSSGTTRAARTILVVEDEEQVLRVVEQILRRHRYGVLVAQNAKEALSICERHPGNIDLLVTDVVMQEMNGPELAEQLLERRPEMKVLYMSGYTGDVELLSGEEGENSSFLQKPVTPETLRRKVRGILHSPRAPGSSIPSA
jgi:CheY-like chemotaxis protein